MNIFKQFLHWIKSERRVSYHTQSAYMSDVKKYLEFLQSKNLQPEQGARSHIQEFIITRRTLSAKSSTIAREISSIRAFCKFLYDEGYSEKDHGDEIRTPRLEQKIPFVLSEKQIELLMAIIPNKRECDLRLRAMTELTYATGMRVSEMVSIEMRQIDFKDNFICIVGKGRKERVVFFGNSARTAILQYLEVRKEKESIFLFPSKLSEPMSRQEFWRQLHTLAKGAGISENLSPHTLRHSFATHLLKRGAGLNYIREMLGHRSICTTQIYTRVTPHDLKEAHTKFHPRGEKVNEQ